MPLASALATFFLIWWITLFAVLPWGIRSQHEGGAMVPGTDPGAPTQFAAGLEIVVDDACRRRCSSPRSTMSTAEHLVTLDGLMSPFVRLK